MHRRGSYAPFLAAEKIKGVAAYFRRARAKRQLTPLIANCFSKPQLPLLWTYGEGIGAAILSASRGSEALVSLFGVLSSSRGTKGRSLGASSVLSLDVSFYIEVSVDCW